MATRIERVVTSGRFTLDGGTRDVGDGVRIVGDEAPHLATWLARDH